MLKVSATWHDGYRMIGTVTLAGRDAAAKAQRTGEAILGRVRRILATRKLADFTETSLEVLGAEATYGANARPEARNAREVVLKIGARHADEKALEVLAREIAPAASSMAQGLTGFFSGRPTVQPVMRLFSFLWPKANVAPLLRVGDEEVAIPFAPSQLLGVTEGAAGGAVPTETAAAEVPLISLGVGRSGDKGNAANIGIIARRPDYLPWLRQALTADAVLAFFAHAGVSKVERFELPGIHALNFVLHDALGGGGVASLRIDPQGKAFAQMLMDHPVGVSQTLADQLALANRR
jgi:hypothetical protein